MQNPLRRGIIACLASLAVSAAVADALVQPADPYAPAGDPYAQPGDPYGAPGQAPTLIDVDFKGGTLAEFVQAVRAAAAPKPVNVMFVADASADHPMPAVNFRQVSIRNALDAIEWSGQAKEGQYQVVERDSGGGEPIYAIHHQKPMVAPRPMQGPAIAEVQVFMIRDLIEAPTGAPADPTTIMEAESLLNAVDAVLASVPEYAPEPTVRFHPESATLIVNAPREQLDAIRSMLSNLHDDVLHRRGRAAVIASRIEDAQARSRRSLVELQAMEEAIFGAERQVEMAGARLASVRQLHEAGTATADEVAEAEHRLSQARGVVAQVNAQRQLKEIELQVARSDLEAARQGAAQAPASAEAHAANYHDPIVLRARPETIAIFEAIREAMPAGGLPTINTNTDQGLTVTATEPQHAIIRAAIAAMEAAAANPPQPANNRRE